MANRRHMCNHPKARSRSVKVISSSPAILVLVQGKANPIMRFLRTASTGRLLALIGGIVIAIAAGTAIAVAATGNGPVPKAKPLAQSVHDALTASPVKGITADITFTNNLISSDDLPGETADPLLQGTRHGRVWLSNDGRLRIELQGDNGDANLVVTKTSFWISDPMQHT